jgi:hypothetical protein
VGNIGYATIVEGLAKCCKSIELSGFHLQIGVDEAIKLVKLEWAMDVLNHSVALQKCIKLRIFVNHFFDIFLSSTIVLLFNDYYFYPNNIILFKLTVP